MLTVRSDQAACDEGLVVDVDEVDDDVVGVLGDEVPVLEDGPPCVVVVVVVGGMDVDVTVGAMAAGLSPTWESAALTICQVRKVVTTSAAPHAAAIFQENMSPILPGRGSSAPQSVLNIVSRSQTTGLL
ncbi:MAG TPA: hypothetical protein VMQ46_06595 [Acidimicrobiia bacterium]|nr:hypothetical protein [Acidimicrobiia bacterium]